MGGKMSRDKGKRGEREIIDLLQPVVNEVREYLELPSLILKRNTLQSDRGGSDIAGLPWLAAEVKFHDKLNVEVWWKQTQEQCEAGQVPILFYRTTGQRSWMVRMMTSTIVGPRELIGPANFSMKFFLQWFRVAVMCKGLEELEKD